MIRGEDGDKLLKTSNKGIEKIKTRTKSKGKRLETISRKLTMA
ncbi:hypothetical protein LEP1GSC047_1527 [Leptospira inadai serovar Lyme str. 10]|uniref:Uncharacterized protein n=1 Tax=Leptospira inadai serovar Lyme str. 10 TaxID=1049790 RepID=V6HH11_9LEPT|nr:hypothetical protein LEP1GSC047_1527 [Leptospira inadai serovar Lyme str. 10]